MNNNLAINTYLSITTLNVNGLNATIKRLGVAEWRRRHIPYICCVRETLFRLKNTHRLQVGMKKEISCKLKPRKHGIAILSWNKIHFKTMAITRDKEGPSNFTSGYLFKETQNMNSKRHVCLCSLQHLFTIANIWQQPKCPLIDK